MRKDLNRFSQKITGPILTWTGLTGGSSKYSREALEDRCGEGFSVNSCWTLVSHS